MIALIREMCHGEFEYPYGLTTPGGYALMAQRYLHESNGKREHLHSVAVTMRQHAQLKENAMNKDDLSLDDIVNTRLLASPLTKYDCSIVSDGGAAFIVTTNAKAKELGLKQDPIYLHGMGQGFSHQYLTSCADLDQIYGAIETSAQKAFETAGMTNKDVDITVLYH